MGYIEKEMNMDEEQRSDIQFLISDCHNRCNNKTYSAVEIPVEGGSVRIIKPAFLKHKTVIQAELYATGEQLNQYLEGVLESYRDRWSDQNHSLKDLSSRGTLARDSIALSFEKEMDAAEFLEGDEKDIPLTVPINLQVYPGRLRKDDEDFEVERGVLEKVYRHEVDGKEIEDYCPVFVREVILNSEKMDQINSKYLAKRGIDNKLHRTALMMAEAAKRALGFDYIERKGECLTQVCVSPKEDCLHDLPSILLEDTYSPSFREIVVNFRKLDEYGDTKQALDIEITGGNNEDGRRLVKIEAEGRGSMELFQELFSNLEPNIPEGSVMSYTEFEKSGALKTIEAIGNVALDIVLTPICAIGGGIGKGKDTFNKIKGRSKKKRDEEDELLTGHFKSLGIRTNITRGKGCLFQYDRDVCLNNAREGQKEQQE